MENKNNEAELNAIRALAATTKTPFRTAFKATLGVAAAQIVVATVFFCGVATVATVVYFLSR